MLQCYSSWAPGTSRTNSGQLVARFRWAGHCGAEAVAVDLVDVEVDSALIVADCRLMTMVGRIGQVTCDRPLVVPWGEFQMLVMTFAGYQVSGYRACLAWM